ncbi:hypothetical protein ABT158_48675 [Nonomuraea sp. NPDC001636]
MRGIAYLLAVMARVYEFLGTLMTVAFGWAVLWAITQGLVSLAWSL